MFESKSWCPQSDLDELGAIWAVWQVRVNAAPVQIQMANNELDTCYAYFYIY